MLDYEYLFATNLHARLKERIIGSIFCRVDDEDRLCVTIKSKRITYEWVDHSFSEKLIHGYSADEVARTVYSEYRKFVMIHYFR